jgi:hypothetical protein
VLPGYVKVLEVLKARVAFVTARPEFVQRFTHRTLRNHYGIPTAIVLSGQLKDSLLVPFKPDYANRLISGLAKAKATERRGVCENLACAMFWGSVLVSPFFGFLFLTSLFSSLFLLPFSPL